MARRPIPRALRGSKTATPPAGRAKSAGKAVTPRRTQGSVVTEPTRGDSTESRRPSPRPSPRPTSDSSRSRTTRSKSAGRRRRRRVQNRWLPFQTVSGLTLVVLALIVVLLGALAGGLGFWQRYNIDAQAAGTSAKSAAAVQSQTLFSYDYRHLDQDIAASRKVITGQLAIDFVTTSTKVVAPQATANKAVVQATATASSVITAAPDSVTVLVFLNQAVQNKNIKGTRLDQYRVRMTMQKVSGNWLISQATPL